MADVMTQVVCRCAASHCINEASVQISSVADTDTTGDSSNSEASAADESARIFLRTAIPNWTSRARSLLSSAA
jgi:hypothetical protein